MHCDNNNDQTYFLTEPGTPLSFAKSRILSILSELTFPSPIKSMYSLVKAESSVILRRRELLDRLLLRLNEPNAVALVAAPLD